jgi:hypothetical protein
MNISNESNVALPKELAKAIETAKNTLTVTEQETKRLIVLAKDQESIVRGLLEKKAEAEEQAILAGDKLDKVKAEVADLSKQVLEKAAQLKEIEAGLSEAVEIQAKFKEAKDALKSLISELN